MAKIHPNMNCFLCGKVTAIPEYNNFKENFIGDAFSGYKTVEHDCTPSKETLKALEKVNEKLKNLNK